MTRIAPLKGRQIARGVAALTVVMVLFFVMALVSAYTNRNLMFEQRISANSYRATRALEAADAGVEWTLAMLNGGRINANCTRPAATDAGAAALTDFRSRYLVPSASETFGEGAFELPWGQVAANRAYPACIIVDGNLRCVCPTVGAAVADINAPADGIGSAFRITFRLFNDNTPRGGAIQFVARGCANPGQGNTSCHAQTDAVPAVDSVTGLITTVGLVRALPVAPKAALTAGGNVSGTGSLRVSNGDFASGATVLAGGPLTTAGPNQFSGPAGTDSDGRVDNDTVLQTLSGQGIEPWFRAQFVLDRASYQRQPAAVRLDCAAGCDGAAIAAALLLNPRNPIWAEGNVNLDADGALGSAADPVMLIVTGNLTISGDVQATGYVHADQINWSAPATAWWDGALVSRTSFDASSTATLRYSKPALDIIRLRYGSFVRAPGGWNLF